MLKNNLEICIARLPALFALLVLLFATTVGAGEVTVAVAANFSAPAKQIAAQFQKESGHRVKLSFGSSGKLYAQIKNGAPYDVFLSGDEKIPKLLEQEGLSVKHSRFVYAQGKLVLWSAQAGYVGLNGEVLRTSDYKKLAIANPKLAPYGQAAKETLISLRLWNKVQRNLITGESILQAYQFAATGNAKVAFVALSQVNNDNATSKGSHWLVPSNLYHPIKQSAVQLAAAKNPVAAQAFLEFLRSKKAVAIIQDFGYELF